MGILVGLGLSGGSEVWNWRTRKRKWQGWKRDMAREGGREGGQNPKPFAQWASKLAELGGPDYSNIHDTSQAELIYAPLPFTYILIQH